MAIRRLLIATIFLLFSFGLPAQYPSGMQDNDSLSLTSPDPFLVSLFNWAKQTSLGYVGDPNDPVGPWYEAALPKREAFCIRDVSHQSIGAEILGLQKENRNMMQRFAENISAAKDFCSYWEINRYNKPAPVDYASDDDFWYNLNANFDIIDACYKLYQWTGDTSYISDPVFDRFFTLTLNEYVERWQLGVTTIMQRPPLMNLRPGTVKYRQARGIPSYDEGQDDITVSSDLLGMIANGFSTYGKMLQLRGRENEARKYLDKAEAYRRLIEKQWWDKDTKAYYGFYKTDGKFYHGGIAASEFLHWYDVVSDRKRIERSLSGIRNTQIEVLSYLPYLFYRNGLKEDAYAFLQKILADKRRDYPEGAFSAIESIIRGTMGIEAEASSKRVTTCPMFTRDTHSVTVKNIPVFSGSISVAHVSDRKTTFTNLGEQALSWRVKFYGAYPYIESGGKRIKTSRATDRLGHLYSYADLQVEKGQALTAEAVK